MVELFWNEMKKKFHLFLSCFSKKKIAEFMNEIEKKNLIKIEF